MLLRAELLGKPARLRTAWSHVFRLALPGRRASDEPPLIKRRQEPRHRRRPCAKPRVSLDARANELDASVGRHACAEILRLTRWRSALRAETRAVIRCAAIGKRITPALFGSAGKSGQLTMADLLAALAAE